MFRISRIPPMPAAARHIVALGLLLAGVAGGALAAVIEVTTLNDTDVNDGQCSLREAIEAANLDQAWNGCPAGSGSDEIQFVVTGTIALNADLQEIAGPLAIVGPGRSLLVVDGGSQHSVFRIDAVGSALLEISDLTITRAAGGFGSALALAIDDSATLRRVLISDSTAQFGGAVHADDAGELSILESELRGNRGNLGGGGVWISASQALLVADSTVAGNFAGPTDGTTDANGGGLFLAGTPFEIRRSTLSGNGARGHGGAAYISNAEGLLRSSTVVLNFADPDNDGHNGGGFRLENLAEVDVANSVVAANLTSTAGGAEPDFSVSNSTVTSLSYNWIGNHAGAETAFPAPTVAGTPNINSDYVGTPGAVLNPGLGPLANYGGPTRTHHPLVTSGLLDQANCPGATRDQRGFRNLDTDLRTVDLPAVPNLGDGCDIGAVEGGAESTDSMPFLDGFESGDTAGWSAVSP